MNTRIAYVNDEGGLSIIVPAPEMFDPNSKTRELLRSKGIDFENDQQIWDYIGTKDIPAGRAFRAMDVSALPSFRDFRNAWMDDGANIVHDMAKANAIKRDQLRELRAPKLDALDVAYMRADEAKDDNAKADVSAQKQALRDVTAFPDFSDAVALKDYLPDVLKSKG